MNIESIVRHLMNTAQEIYKRDGYLCSTGFFILKGRLVILPTKLIEIFNNDRERYCDIVRQMVKQTCPDAVAIICEAWVVENKDGKIEQPSTSPRRKECALLTVDSKVKQITFIADIANKKMSGWMEFGMYDKLNPMKDSMRISGNLIDFYGTGTSLNVPFDMHVKPNGNVKDIPTIDGEI